MSWEVRVEGPEAVLRELAAALEGQDPTIRRVGPNFVLTAQFFDGLSEPAAVRSEAERMVEALSGTSRLLLQAEGGLQVGAITWVRPDGSRNVFIQVGAGEIRMSGGLASLQIHRADGSVEERKASAPAAVWLQRALQDASAAKALRLRNVDELDWSDRLFEVIEAGVGGAGALVANGWVTHSDIRRFKHTANSVAAAGDSARHGVEPTAAPSKPMALAEARSFVDGLLKAWFGDGAA